MLTFYMLGPKSTRTLGVNTTIVILNTVSGHITIGGSICMEVLTRSGWRPANDIEVKYMYITFCLICY